MSNDINNQSDHSSADTHAAVATPVDTHSADTHSANTPYLMPVSGNQ